MRRILATGRGEEIERALVTPNKDVPKRRIG